MFPLQTVLFPNAVLPLHVFEPRYRELTETCLRGDGRFGVVLIERGADVGGGDSRFSVGTVARIVEAARTPDGRYLLATVGGERLRVRRWLRRRSVPACGDRRCSPSPSVSRARDRPTRSVVERLLVRVLALWAELGQPAPSVDAVQLDADPIRASFEAAAMAPIGPLDAQRLIEIDDPCERFERLEAMLNDEVELLQMRLAEG